MADISLVIEVLGEESMQGAITATNRLEKGMNRLNKEFQRNRLTESQLRSGMNQLAKTATVAGRTYQNNLSVTTKYTNEILRNARAHNTLQSEVGQTVASQRALNSQLALGGNQIARYDNNAQRAAQTFKRRFNTGLQQAGYQVGDFFVQISSGQSALVAFGQQGSQLAGIFGPGGALFGALLAIGTAIGVLWQNMSRADEIEDAEKSLNAFVSALENINEVAEWQQMSLQDLGEEFGRFAIQIKKSTDFLLQNRAAIALDTFFSSNAFADVEESLSSVTSALEAWRAVIDSGLDAASTDAKIFMESAEEAADALGVATYQATLLDSALQGLKSAKSLEEVGTRAANLLELLRRMKENTESELSPELRKLVPILEAITGAIGRAENAMNGLTTSAKGFVSVFDGLGDGFLENRVRAGVKAGTIPPWALEDLPMTEAEEALKKIYEDKRNSKDRDKKSGSKKQDPLEKLKEQIRLERRLLGETEARQRVIKALGKDYDEYSETAIAGIVAEIEELQRLQREMDKLQEVSDSIEGGFTDFFNSLVDGTITVKDAFKDMARSILADLWEIYVTRQIVDSIMGVVDTFLGVSKSANGNVFSKGNIVPFADGGIVNRPTLFPMANGMGLMGEAGPEAVMPLKRGRDGKLGVATEGGGGDTYVINQSFNFSANGDDSVKRILLESAPQISNYVKRDIIASRQRGGQMRQVFR